MAEHPETIAFCHSCSLPMDVSAMGPFTNVVCPQCGKHTRVKREFGPYTLVRRHAVGGMSMVFAAFDNTLNREVALKILSEDFSADERRIAAFEEEARITASFSHPNVVRVLRTGRAFGRFYIAMEFVPGGHFEHQITERGRIPEIEMLPLAIEVASGLKAAHAAGLIHRDVKPGNILLDSEGHAKLVDFGLALVTQGGKAQATELWATPYYVPPETVEGYSEDFRSDIYAFGATLYHALIGKPPCGEESMATEVLREAKKKVIPLQVADPSISADLSRIVDRAMAYDPGARYQSYDELISNLGSVLSRLKSGRPKASDTAAMRRAGRKRKERTVLVAGILLILLVSGGVVWWVKRGGIRKPEVNIQNPQQGTFGADLQASADVARRYNEARAEMEARNFDRAAKQFTGLFEDSSVQEPTRTWAGVETVMASLLSGKSKEARAQAHAAAVHARSVESETGRIDGKLIGTLEEFGKLAPLSAPDEDAVLIGAPGVAAAMLAGLKNWDQGMLDPAASCFTKVLAAKLPPEDSWAAIYQRLAADYLSDHRILSGPLFEKVPADKASCEATIGQLDAVLGNLKTEGRARFNVRAWQLDLRRQMKLTEDSK